MSTATIIRAGRHGVVAREALPSGHTVTGTVAYCDRGDCQQSCVRRPSAPNPVTYRIGVTTAGPDCRYLIKEHAS